MLKQMTSCYAVSGNEQKFAHWFKEKLKSYAAEISVDQAGNVIARRGNDPSVGLFAHMDSVGFMVKNVDGRLAEVVPVGAPHFAPWTRVSVLTRRGEVAGVLVGGKESCFVDVGTDDKGRQVAHGDPVVFAANFVKRGDIVFSQGLDNKLGCLVALEVFKRARNVTLAGTVREEQNPSGAALAVCNLHVSEALVIDATCSPNGPTPVEIGRGPVIYLKDTLLPSSRESGERLIAIADAKGIPYQVLRQGSPETIGIALEGIPILFIGIPIYHMHSPNEIAHLRDIKDAARLISMALAEREKPKNKAKPEKGAKAKMSRDFSLELYTARIKERVHRQLALKFPESAVSLADIQLTKPPDLELGQFACPCFPFAQKLKLSPAQIASALADNFDGDEYIGKLECSGPYLNIKVDLANFARHVCESVFAQGDNFGRNETGKGQKAMVEYSSPNTNKPLHIGHVRNNLIGMALSNVLEFSGYKVIKANLINDRGIHICKSMLAYQKWGDHTTPESSGVKGDHLVGQFYVRFENALKEERESFAAQKGIDLAKFHKDYHKALKEKIRASGDKAEKQKLQGELRSLTQQSEEFEEEFLSHSRYYAEAMELLRRWEQNDPETRALWKKMNEWVIEGFHKTYKVLGCEFDKFYFESDTYTLGRRYVEHGVKSEVFHQKEDGSIWVSGEKLKEICPSVFKDIQIKDKLLLRSDGTSVYITQDIGTAVLKYQDFSLDHSLYVVADEQNLHFKILFGVLKMLNFSWADHCVHLGYGMVTLPHGMGKIKSREGTAVDADDLISEMVDRVKEKIRSAVESGEVHVPEDKIEQTALDIALAALKVFILEVSLEKNIQFDPTKSISFTGDTGPAIQYSYARICGIMRKAEGLTSSPSVDYALLTAPEEVQVLRQLCEFPDTILMAAKTYDVSPIANYLLSLTKLYARLYTAHPVLKAQPDALRDARLTLAKATAQVLKNGMALLGIDACESM